MSIDMSGFEAQFDPEPEGEWIYYPKFSPHISNDDFERIRFLTERISDIDGVIDMREAESEKLREQYRQVADKIQELERQIRLLREEIRPIEELGRRNKSDNRRDGYTRDNYERELKRLLEELSARLRLAAERSALEERSKDFPWAKGVDGKKALPHQLEGAHRLVSTQRGLLGDKPGLGKTLEAIMTIDLLRLQGKANKVLIFTPKPVLNDFKRAFDKWTNPTFVHVLNQTLKGIKTEILEVIKHMPEAILITNYEVWRKDKTIHEKLIECGFDTIFMDEAHVLKNSKSATSKNLKEIIYAENKCPSCGHHVFVDRGFRRMCAMCEKVQENFGDFCSVKNVYPMTGTPILNKPQELWPLLNMIDRQAYPTENAFLKDYCIQKEDSSGRKFWTFKYGGSEMLLKKLGMRYTARTRDSAGVEMPPQEVVHHWLELDPEKYPKQEKFIKLLREKAQIAFSEDQKMTTQAVIAWYTRMRQAVVWPDGIRIKGCAHEPICYDDDGLPGGCYAPSIVFPPPGTPAIGESVLLDEGEDVIKEAVEAGDRIVVFSNFKDPIFELERRCQALGFRVGKIVGEVPQGQRQVFIDDFNTNHTKIGEHKYDVLLCQYQTASVGLNLNGAHQILMLDREWNPGKEEQAMDRIRRLDSEHDTKVHMLHCEGTATELIDGLHVQKNSMLAGFEADVDLAEAMRKFLEG